MTKIAVIDIETNNIDENKGYIVEIGICELDLENGKIKKLFDKVIKENNFEKQYNVENAWIFKNSSLKINDVMYGESLENVRNEIQNILDKYPVTAFNKQFDFRWLSSRNFNIYVEVSDPMLISKPILKIPHSYYGYKFPNVEELWRYLFPDGKYVELHRAYDDCYHEALLFYELYKKGYIKLNRLIK